MRRFLGGIGVCLLLATVMSYAQTGQSVPTLDNEATGSWFVELASPPTIDGTAVATLDREEAGFHAAAASAGVRYSKGRHFRKLWNGLTVRASAGDIPKLRALPGVQSVYPVVKIALQQVEEQPGAVADLVTALAMTGADIAQSTLGLIGTRRHGGRDRHRHRLRPSGSRRLFRTGLPRRKRVRLRRRRVQCRARSTRLQSDAHARSGSRRLQRSRHARERHHRRQRRRSRASPPA